MPVITTSAGTTTSLIATALQERFPVNFTQLQAWVYGSSTVNETGNRGVERRASTWTLSTSTLAFPSGNPWPTAPGATTVGSGYDLHLWMQHARILEAINEALGELGVHNCLRPAIDTSLTTVDDQWTYTIPASVHWSQIHHVFLEVTDDATLVGFPFESADAWGWHIDRAVSSAGVATYTLQFRDLPPADRTIRLYGEAAYSDLSGDTDVLPLAGKYERAQLGFIYDYAIACIHEWRSNRVPSGDVERPRLLAMQRYEKAMRRIDREAPSGGNPRVVVPGSRGDYPTRFPDPAYIGIRAQDH